MIRNRQCFLCLAVIVLSIVTNSTSACFGGYPPSSFTNRFLASEAVLWGRWTKPARQEEVENKKFEFEILAIGKDTAQEYQVGQKIVVEPFWSSTQTSTFTLFKQKTHTRDDYLWLDSGPENPEAWTYAVGAPSTSLHQRERLPYYVKQLSSSDDFIRFDVVLELRQTKLDDLLAIKDHLDRDILITRMADPDATAYEMDLFGILIGICGSERDAEVLLSMIENDTENRPQPINIPYKRGIITGFLLLSGEKGITNLEKSIWNVSYRKFADVYAAMTAFNYLLEQPPENLPRERLLSTLRKLLIRPDMADLIISSLAKAEDWEKMNEILKLYDDKKYEGYGIKKAIIRYLWSCMHSWDGKVTSELPDYVSIAKKALEQYEKSDPKNYKAATWDLHLKRVKD